MALPLRVKHPDHRMTTTSFDIMKSDPTLGRAEALRHATLAYLNDSSDPRNVYPANWAPFVALAPPLSAKDRRGLTG